MTRRGALATVSVAAAMIAVWAAASGTSGSHAEANNGVQSVIVSIFLPLVIFGVVVMFAGLIAMLTRKRSEGENPNFEVESSRLARILGTVLAIAMLCLFAYVIYSTRAQHHLVAGYGGANLQRGRQKTGGRTVPINGPAFGTTSVLLGLLVAGFLVRRFGWIGRRGRALAELGGPHQLSFAGTRRERPDPSPELGEPADPTGETDPRRAILLAYQRFLWLMSRVGFARAEQETPFEYCERVGSGAPATGSEHAARRRLTSLFSAARYGTEAPSAADRSAALDSLEAISGAIEQDR